LNNLLVVARDEAGAEGILAYDNDLRHLLEFIQRNERATVIGALRILATIAKNSYKRVKSIPLSLIFTNDFVYRLKQFIIKLV
jgi:hypothetical protein